MFASQTLDGRTIPIALCPRCAQDVFSEVGWSKLLGTHPKTPGTTESSDACFDGEFIYTVMALGGKTLPARRSPILRLRITVKELLDSVRDDCGFCRLAAGLDAEDVMTFDKYEKAVLDLQLFAPKIFSDITIRSVIRVTLTLEREGLTKWTNSRLLTMTPEDCKLLSQQGNRGTNLLQSMFRALRVPYDLTATTKGGPDPISPSLACFVAFLALTPRDLVKRGLRIPYLQMPFSGN